MRAPDRRFLSAALAALALAAAAAAQAAERPEATLPDGDVYRREVFQYQRGGRPDPFQPLLSGDDMGVRALDLTLVGIVYSPNPGAAVATFALPDSTQRVRLRVGQRLGSVTVTSIQPRRVELREDELGVSRMYAVELPRPVPGARTPRSARPQPTEAGTPAAPPAPAAEQPAAPARRP